MGLDSKTTCYSNTGGRRRSNDKFRQAVPGEADNAKNGSEEWKMNLQELLGLLNEENEKDYFMKAAVLRELGEFDAAQQALERICSAAYAAYVSQLNSLCEAKDSAVRRFQSEDFSAEQGQVLPMSSNMRPLQVLSAFKSSLTNSLNFINKWLRRVMSS